MRCAHSERRIAGLWGRLPAVKFWRISSNLWGQERRRVVMRFVIEVWFDRIRECEQHRVMRVQCGKGA